MVEEVAPVIPAASVIEVEPIVAPAVEYVTPAVEYVAPAPAPVTEVIETVPVAIVEPVVTEVVTEVVTPAGVVEYATPVVEYTAPAAVPEVVEVVPAVMEYGTAKPAMEYAMPMEVQEPALVVQEQVVQDPMMMQEPVAQEAPSINVLILCTSSDLMSEAAPDKVTGAWLEEIAAPYYMFANAGCQVYLGTLTGTRIPLDEQSLQGDFFTETCARFKEEGGFQLLEEPQALYSITDQGEELLLGPESIDCVFLAGGHGTYTDFLQLAQWITDANFNGKTIGAVCHGVIGLLQAVAVTADGQQVSLLQGRQCTGFSNEEEDAVGLSTKVPFLVQDQMIEYGGDYKCSTPWSDFAIRDGNIITGQNPQSSAQTAELCIQSLQDMLAAQQAQ
jgi:putative intracellular protease/amidase